jgi:hypothetical protein
LPGMIMRNVSGSLSENMASFETSRHDQPLKPVLL